MTEDADGKDDTDTNSTSQAQEATKVTYQRTKVTGEADGKDEWAYVFLVLHIHTMRTRARQAQEATKVIYEYITSGQK